MTLLKRYLAPLFLLIAPQMHAQTLNHNLVLLDPAHGGTDPGGKITDTVLEKDVTLALAGRLRSLLSARGFTVLFTRDADTADVATAPTSDQRADLANHAHPVACLLLHASAAGYGVHLLTSALDPLPDANPPKVASSWDSAQAASLPQSLRLANELGAAIVRTKIPLLLGRASVRPIDNLTCPAVLLELSPLATGASEPTPVTDAPYQQHVAEAIATALLFWRGHADPAALALPPSSTEPIAPASPAGTPAKPHAPTQHIPKSPAPVPGPAQPGSKGETAPHRPAAPRSTAPPHTSSTPITGTSDLTHPTPNPEPPHESQKAKL